MPKHDIPAAGYSLTHGRTPRTGSAKLKVQFRNGHVDQHEYTASQLRFSDTGCAWDVVAVKRADR